jgi:hypothetical protein
MHFSPQGERRNKTMTMKIWFEKFGFKFTFAVRFDTCFTFTVKIAKKRTATTLR